MSTVRRIALAAFAVGLLAAGCAGPAPSPIAGTAPPPTPTPGDLSAVQAALALRGVTIHEVVAGDAGCPSVEGLHSNAARFVISLAGDNQRYEVLLFRWRRPADFDRAAEPFRRCVDEYAAGVAGDASIEELEVAPWRAYGVGWTDDVLTVLEQALRDVRGG